MITARNYAAQAEIDLRKQSIVKQHFNPEYSKWAFELSQIINFSHHFAMPDNGQILNDGWKGLSGHALRLPFNKITVEFAVFNCPFTKIVLVCENNLSKSNVILGFSTRVVGFIASENLWTFVPMGIEIEDQTVSNIKFVKYKFIKQNDFDKSKLSKEQLEAFLISSAHGIFEFLEALTCRNVYIHSLEPIDESKNKKRAAKGKLPLYETKILVVDSSEKTVDTEWKGGKHASPRQHLRRGHIRRYPTYNIWINNMVVGKSADGKIEKSYSVK
jgi:hypothetical protein